MSVLKSHHPNKKKRAEIRAEFAFIWIYANEGDLPGWGRQAGRRVSALGARPRWGATGWRDRPRWFRERPGRRRPEPSVAEATAAPSATERPRRAPGRRPRPTGDAAAPRTRPTGPVPPHWSPGSRDLRSTSPLHDPAATEKWKKFIQINSIRLQVPPGGLELILDSTESEGRCVSSTTKWPSISVH